MEPIERRAPLELVETQFAPAEKCWIDSLSQSEQALGFLRLWTLKEAFVKATGRGLSQPMQDFSIGFDPLGVTFRDPSLGDRRDWRFVQNIVGGGHVLALACRGRVHESTLSVRNLCLETLLAEALSYRSPIRSG